MTTLTDFVHRFNSTYVINKITFCTNNKRNHENITAVQLNLSLASISLFNKLPEFAIGISVSIKYSTPKSD